MILFSERIDENRAGARLMGEHSLRGRNGMDEEQAARDRRWAERLRAGDATALEEVYDTFSVAVYRQALALLGSVPDAEDVVQEVFLKLVRQRGEPIREWKAYLMTAARHEACSTLRKRRHGVGDIEGAVAPDTWAVDPAAAGHAEAIRAAVQSLPQRQREVVMWKFYHQLTFAEIGQLAKVSANTAASRCRYALKKLRLVLRDEFDG